MPSGQFAPEDCLRPMTDGRASSPCGADRVEIQTMTPAVWIQVSGNADPMQSDSGLYLATATEGN